MLITELLLSIGAVGIFRTFIYAIGDPHDAYNPKAILASYSSILASLRMQQLKIYDFPTLHETKSKEESILQSEMLDAYIVERVKPVAGWLNALGFCPTCCSVWFFALFVLIPTGSLSMYGISLLISKIIFKWT